MMNYMLIVYFILVNISCLIEFDHSSLLYCLSHTSISTLLFIYNVVFLFLTVTLMKSEVEGFVNINPHVTRDI